MAVMTPRQFQRTMHYFIGQCELLFQLHSVSLPASLATEADAVDEERLSYRFALVSLDYEQHFLERFYDAWTTEPHYLRYHQQEGTLPYDPPDRSWRIALVGSRERWWFEVTDFRPRYTGASRGRPYRVDPMGSHLFGSTIDFLVRATAVTDRPSFIRIAAEWVFGAMWSGKFGQDAAQFHYVSDLDTVPTVVYLDRD